VHPVTYERSIQKGRGYGIEVTPDLHFKPTHINMNQTETSFVLHGDKGILVGNFPAMLQIYRHKR